jgi:hypothetical protein
MTLYAEDGFSTNEVVGAIAAAAVRDLSVNNFAFVGFPAVEVLASSRVDGFQLRLRHGELLSPTLKLTFSEGKALASSFKKRTHLPSSWMRKVQDLILDLEKQAGSNSLTHRSEGRRDA